MTALVAVVGCSLPRGGTLAQSCTGDVECDDANECTVDSCSSDGLCSNSPQDLQPAGQTPNDCKLIACAAGELATLSDDADFEDDPDDCFIDGCLDGEPTQDRLAEQTSCSVAGNLGRCDAAGTCVVTCTADDAAEKCNDDNACTTDACDVAAGECFHQALDAVSAPGANQIVGDCLEILCVSGAETDFVDDADVPDDGNGCTVDLCNGGMPSNEPAEIAVMCMDAGDALKKLCDDAGSCVQCNSPADCDHLPVDDECQTRTCVAGVCAQTFTPLDTPLNASQQIAGDCEVDVCDGAGVVKTNIDNLDVPVDGNDCTKDVCTNGVPSNPNEDVNTACGAGGVLVCDANGVCVGCNSDAQCDADTACRDWTCNSTVCEFADAAKGTTSGIPQIPNDCQRTQCNGFGQQETVVDDGDLPADDGIQCTFAQCNGGVGSHVNHLINTVCTQNGRFCDGGGTCVDCNKGSQCSGAGDCERDPCKANQCQIVPRNAGYVLPDDPYQTDGDCQTVVCDGDGNVDPVGAVQDLDLPVDNNACTGDVCMSGNASNPNLDPGTACSQNGGNVCDGSGMCIECLGDGDCLANESCSSNVCLSADGQGCSAASECASGNCADGVCCNTPCTGACRGCIAGGMVGTCTNHPQGGDPDGDCGAGQQCDGAGACETSGSTSQVVCSGATCNVGQVCCVGSSTNTQYGCNSSGGCADVQFEASCDGPEDCSAGEVCCGFYDGYRWKSMSCSSSCSNFAGGETHMCSGGASDCPAAHPVCWNSGLLPGYRWCGD
jgi:hypothetical protein